MGGPRRIEMDSLGGFVGIILSSATAAPGFAQNPDLYNPEPVAVLALARADLAFVQAVAHADAAGVERLLDNDLTWTDASGKVQSRAQVLRQNPKQLIKPDTKDAETRTYAYGNL